MQGIPSWAYMQYRKRLTNALLGGVFAAHFNQSVASAQSVNWSPRLPHL